MSLLFFSLKKWLGLAVFASFAPVYGYFCGRLGCGSCYPLLPQRKAADVRYEFSFLLLGVVGLAAFACGLFYGWLLLREPLPPSTEKNSLDYLSRLILLFLAFQCSAYVAILIFGRRYSWLGLWLAGARFEPLRFCLHLSISAWL